MRTIQLAGIRTFKLGEQPAPVLLHEDDVLLRMAVVGVCGSDIHYYKEGGIGSQKAVYPVIIGHEGSAVVEKVGAAVQDFSPGDRVAFDPAVSCTRCDQCLSGREHTCRNLRFIGAPGELDGCMVELITLPARNCVALPAHVSLEQGALAEPLSIALYALDFFRDKSVYSMAILGAGPIGLCTLLEARARGLTDILVSEKLAHRRSVVEQRGAVWSGDPDHQDLVAEILRSRPQQLDAVVDCCGDPAALQQAVALLKPGGTLVIVGIPSVDSIAFDPHLLRRKEITLQPVRRQNRCLARAVQRIATGQVDVDFLVTHRGGPSQVQELFEVVAAYADKVLKALIHFA